MSADTGGSAGLSEDLDRITDAARSLSGMDFLRGIGAGDLPLPPILRTLDIEPVEVTEGRAVFSVVPRRKHYNAIGTVHGGLAAALCDTAMGCAVHTLLPKGTGYTTLEMKVNYVRPVTLETGELRCEGSVVHAGSRTATARADVRDAAGALYAHASTTCMIFRPKPDGG